MLLAIYVKHNRPNLAACTVHCVEIYFIFPANS